MRLLMFRSFLTPLAVCQYRVVRCGALSSGMIGMSIAVLLIGSLLSATGAAASPTASPPNHPIRQAIRVFASPSPVQQSGATDPVAMEMSFPQSGSNAISTAAGDASSAQDNAGIPGLSAEQMEQAGPRLEMLSGLSFSRAPSALLEAWSADRLRELGIRPAAELAEDLPPGAPQEDLLDDERFAAFQADLQHCVRSGDWDQLRQRIGFLGLAGQRKVFRRVLQALADPGAVDPRVVALAEAAGVEVVPEAMEKQFLAPDSLMALLEVSPDRPLDVEDLPAAGTLAARMLEAGVSLESLLTALRREIAVEHPQRKLEPAGAARLLFHAGQLDATGEFLPDFSTVAAARDFSTMNFLCEQQLAVFAKEGRAILLEQVWNHNLEIVEAEGVPETEFRLALERAVRLASRVPEKLGKQWLDSGFRDRPELGVRMLAAIGTAAMQARLLEGQSPANRLELLKFQRDTVAALLPVIGDQPGAWRSPLEWMAVAWLREAETTYQLDTSRSSGPAMRRDNYGNIFYMDEGESGPFGRSQGSGTLQPIPTGELMDVRPGEEWLRQLSEPLRPRFDMLFAQLYLKVGDEDQALPCIERLVATHPRTAVTLVEEFLRVWTLNHDPNSDRNRSDYYMYMYGFEQKAESIPLTRSKQQRNIEKLAGLLPRLRAIAGDRLDQDLLANAFLTCHSHAEVYRIEDLEKIFGDFAAIKPEVVGSLTQRMRGNLATVWRDLQTQLKAGTRRNQAEMIAEVQRGYAVAAAVAERGLELHPGHWSLMLIRASLMFDRLEFQSRQSRSAEYSALQAEAMAAFQAAANAYAARVPELEKTEYSTEVYERWFYASLGASELNLVDATHLTDEQQPPRIVAALEQLPPEARDWHLARFANLLFNRMSNVQPAVKKRYLDAGFRIVGDHPQARQAREVHEYYSDLVTEIRLTTRLDGPVQVGEKPFGVFVNLEHTREIERESGGFAKYLQNQNSSNGFFYNYGRPTEDYRDRFDEQVREKLGSDFEVMSVTFQVPEVQSRPGKQPGWRETPYAYLLLKAKGPEVDRLPSLKLDLDFLDTSGYAILPVESDPVMLDASRFPGEPRPWSDLQVTQILDERQMEEGKLILEVRATGRGLVPEFEELFGAVEFGGFEPIQPPVDEGLVIEKFDETDSRNVVASQRSWTVNLRPSAGAATDQSEFRFPDPALPVTELVWQRYEDADLQPVAQVVRLQEALRPPGFRRGWWMAAAGVGGIGLLLGGIALVRSMRRRPTGSLELPQQLTPFGLIGMLKQIDANSLGARQREELAESIATLERWYFASTRPEMGEASGAAPDLGRIARTWLDKPVRRARNGSAGLQRNGAAGSAVPR